MSNNVVQNALLVGTSSQTTHTILETLAAFGVRGELATTEKAALDRLDGSTIWDMVFVNVTLPKGLMVVSHLRCECPDLPILAVGHADDVQLAVATMRAGSSDYLSLPLDANWVETTVQQFLPQHNVELLARDQQDDRLLYRMAGCSATLKKTIDLARRVARSSMPVLISGESGTGKELLAYLLHRESNRRENPYIRVNCAALSETLLESELFGHERGAFTGAHSQRKGRFELAHRGTLLLDEISETGPRLQAELLRVLEQQDFQRVGGTESINVNVRIVCTSNRDLAAEVEKGKFRRDLYYRIRGVQLTLPSLRERTEDLCALTWHFVNMYAGETGRQITALDETMLDQFAAFHWPGNIRQLRNMVRSLLVLGEGDVLSLDGAETIVDELTTSPASSSRGAEQLSASLSLEAVERQAVIEALRRTNAHQAKAARLLGISDRTLRDKVRRYRQDGHLDLETLGESKWLAHRAS